MTSQVTALSFGLLSPEALRAQSGASITNAAIAKRHHPGEGSSSDVRLGVASSSMLCGTCGGDLEQCSGHCGHVELPEPVVSAHFLPLICKLLSCVCIRCSRLLVPSSHPRLAAIRADASLSFRQRINAVSSLAQRYRHCMGRHAPMDAANAAFTAALTPSTPFTLPNHALPELHGPLPATEADVVGYCGARQPDSFCLFENTLLSVVWPSAPAPPVTPRHLLAVLQRVDRSTVELFGFCPDASPLSSVFFTALPVPPLVVRPSRSSFSGDDDITLRVRGVVRLVQAYPHDQSSNLSCLAGEQPVMSSTFTRNKAGVVPASLDAYFDLQRNTAAYQDARLFVKLDGDYGRDRASINSRFASTSGTRGRMRTNLLGKRNNLTARLVASPCTHMPIDSCGVPISILMHLTLPERVTVLNYQRLAALVAAGPSFYPGANRVERDVDSVRLHREYVAGLGIDDADMQLPSMRTPMTGNGLRIGDIVHRHHQRGDLILLNRQPSLHRHSILAYKIVPTRHHSIQIHLAVTTSLNGDFDGDELNLFAFASLDAMAEARELMAVGKNLFGDGSLLVGLVQHAVLGAYKLTQYVDSPVFSAADANQRMYMADVDVALFEHEVTGRELLHAILPNYAKTEPLTKKALNNLVASHLRDTPSDASVAFITSLTTLLEAYASDVGASISYHDCSTTRSEDTHRRVTHARTRVQLLTDELENCDFGNVTERSEEEADVEDQVAVLLDRARDVVGADALDQLRARKTAFQGLLDITTSGAKGNATHVTQNAGAVGQQLNAQSRRQIPTRCHVFADNAAANGFVDRSFGEGLTSLQFMSHLAAARIGLVATAVDTSVTGYAYRCLAKSLEDLRVCFDTSIRTADNVVVVNVFGFDTTHLQQHVVHLLTLPSIEAVVELYGQQHVSDDDPASLLAELERLLRLRHSLVTVRKRVYRHCPMPLSFSSLPGAKCDGSTDGVHVAPTRARAAVAEMWRRLVDDCHVPSDTEVMAVYFEGLSTYRMLQYGLLRDADTFATALGFVHHRMSVAVVVPGDASGLRVSQSFAQPLTQLNLDRFHLSGDKSTLVGGVARIREIINLATTPATPSMSIFLRSSSEHVDPLALVQLKLSAVVTSWHDTDLAEDSDEVGLVLHLHKAKLVARRFPPRLVAEHLRGYKHHRSHEGVVAFAYSELTDDKWSVTLRAPRTAAMFQSIIGAKACRADMPVPLVAMHWQHALLHDDDDRLMAGIAGISDFFVKQREVTVVDGGRVSREQRTVIITLGSNLFDVCCLPYVDIERTTTNNLLEIYHVFGIDAAAKAIEDELVDVMLASSASVTRKHVKVIAAAMTSTGRPLALNFTGLANGSVSNFKLATFERALDSFLSAAVEGHHDKLRGTSESIVAGTRMSMGSGIDIETRTAPWYSPNGAPSARPMRRQPPLLLAHPPTLPDGIETDLCAPLARSIIALVPPAPTGAVTLEDLDNTAPTAPAEYAGPAIGKSVFDNVDVVLFNVADDDADDLASVAATANVKHRVFYTHVPPAPARASRKRTRPVTPEEPPRPVVMPLFSCSGRRFEVVPLDLQSVSSISSSSTSSSTSSSSSSSSSTTMLPLFAFDGRSFSSTAIN